MLIANRGEMAVRIEKTLKKMGIQSVALYTEVDQDSLHVEYADEAILIEKGTAENSYLNTEKILNIAIANNVDAIHPGSGFLSGNADFARKCRENGITFIGPVPEQMEICSMKHTTRNVAEKMGIPILPGTPLLLDVEDAIMGSNSIGYPVMLKSTSHDAGIGTRLCKNEVELEFAFDSLYYLNENPFTHNGIYLEQYIPNARYIEVPIFGNHLGEVLVLGERDCSLQFGHQQVLEESPSPILPPYVREAMRKTSIEFAEKLHYRNAGTVVFLYDPETKNYYFTEIVPGLSGGYGLTEELFGIDLIEMMVKEAADELMNLHTLRQEPQGCTLQVNLCAIDDFGLFQPSAGRLEDVSFSEIARNDTWVREELTVSTVYDCVVAKVIVHGATREEALHKLHIALGQTNFYGITTNLQDVKDALEEVGLVGAVYTSLWRLMEEEELQNQSMKMNYWDEDVLLGELIEASSYR